MGQWRFGGATLSCLALLALTVADSAVAQGQQAAIVIEGATLIDGNGGAPVANSAVVIQGNRITAVGRKGIRRPAGAQVIDATGKFIIPGLIDAKSNYASNFNEGYLVWGATSAVVSGGSGDAGTAERDAINAGVLRGPRLYLSFASVNYSATPDNGVPSRTGYGGRTPAEARALTAKFFDAGADFAATGEGAGPPEYYAAIVAEAKKRGKASVMRAVGPGTTAKELAEMGADVAIHAGQVGMRITTDATVDKWKNYIALPPDEYSDMDDAKALAMAKFIADRHLALEPDINAMDRGFTKNWARIQQEDAQWYRDYQNNPGLKAYFPDFQAKGYLENAASVETYMDPPAIAVRRAGHLNKMRFLKMFVDAGGHLVTASDIPQNPPGLGVHQEIATFVEDVGLTPMQAILAATGWASDAFKLPDVGRIQPGKLADMIILTANPLQDILNTRKIDTVIKDGQIVDRTYHADALDKSFRVGINEYNGGCCFSSPVVETGAWLNALKAATWRPDNRNGGFNGNGGFDTQMAPTPGIEAIMPYVIKVDSPATPVKITGFNFVRGSQVLVNGRAVPAMIVSRTEIQITFDTNVLSNPGRYLIQVRNPAPVATKDWGDTSNIAKITVPTRFTTVTSDNKF